MIQEWSLADIEHNYQEKKLQVLKEKIGKQPTWWPDNGVTTKVTQTQVIKSNDAEPVIKTIDRTIDQRNDEQMWANKETRANVRRASQQNDEGD